MIARSLGRPLDDYSLRKKCIGALINGDITIKNREDIFNRIFSNVGKRNTKKCHPECNTNNINIQAMSISMINDPTLFKI